MTVQFHPEVDARASLEFWLIVVRLIGPEP